MAGTLYLVATPIGNLNDLSPRARETLTHVAAVVCEDTRVTKKLLDRFEIHVPTLSYHHHSPPAALGGLLTRLRAGESLAYVADAGTPGIADPGGKLVAAAVAAGIPMVPIPGPSAITAALSVAGFPANTYLFLGFPPHKKGRQTFFKRVADSDEVVVFYESTHRIMKTMSELETVASERPLVVARELTKLYETIYRGTAVEVAQQLKDSSVKGEFVIVVGPR